MFGGGGRLWCDGMSVYVRACMEVSGVERRSGAVRGVGRGDRSCELRFEDGRGGVRGASWNGMEMEMEMKSVVSKDAIVPDEETSLQRRTY